MCKNCRYSYTVVCYYSKWVVVIIVHVKKNLRQYDSLPKMSQVEAAFKLGLSQPFLSKLLKNRNKILTDALGNGNPDRKRNRHGKDEQVEKALKNWVTIMREKDGRISGYDLKVKAVKFCFDNMQRKYSPTNDWFTRWLKRENLVYKKSQGEQRDADRRAADS